MKISQCGLDNLIKHFEGLRLTAYPDPGSGGIPWTIGYGHTKGVKKGDTCSAEQAHDFLLSDVQYFESAVLKMVKNQLSQHQFDAVISFIFNVGESNFRKSTMLKKINAGDFEGAGREFIKWVFAAGRVMPGLLRRRQAEADWFNKGENDE